MKHIIKQTTKTKGYCTVLTFANVFRNESFLKHLENEKFKDGCDDYDELMMLEDYDENLILTSIAFSHSNYGVPLPKNFVLDILSFSEADLPENGHIDICLVPYILNVRRIKEYHHTVAVLKYRNFLIFSDPWNENYILIKKWNDLFSYFIDCWGIKRLTIKDTQKFALLRGELLGYDFLKEIIPANS